MPTNRTTDSPQSLVAIIRAAHLAGDRSLERAARSELRERFGMDVSFVKRRHAEAAHA